MTPHTSVSTGTNTRTQRCRPAPIELALQVTAVLEVPMVTSWHSERPVRQ